eukprot:NODE_3374_length_1231_cov_101.532491_g3203_i0.p1 GENE.NODE_3374_length_1231_cov_101.532491_g3203_i0~~NODE_3374_length_1231_cov_101.532491_g3203_i0.p1  ORF type:complete len:319 (-),score=57.51 NODE_3374_length_1231_cov_101.532491_g3203_i0:224-1180(-)
MWLVPLSADGKCPAVVITPGLKVLGRGGSTGIASKRLSRSQLEVWEAGGEVHVRRVGPNPSFVRRAIDPNTESRVQKGEELVLEEGDRIFLLKDSFEYRLQPASSGEPPEAEQPSPKPTEKPTRGRSPARTMVDLGVQCGLPWTDEDESTPAPKRQKSSHRLVSSEVAAAAKKMAENMTCSICQLIFYKPVTLIPCMHNFCAPCYSRWLDRSEHCPECRTAVTEVRRNLVITNLLDDFLVIDPSKKRTPEEMAELDAHNKVTDDSLRVAGIKRIRRPESIDSSFDLEEATTDGSLYDPDYDEYIHDDDDDEYIPRRGW